MHNVAQMDRFRRIVDLSNTVAAVEPQTPAITASDARTTIEVLKAGHWSTPNHGDFDVTADDIADYAANFARNVRPQSSQHGLPIDQEHDKGAAKAWLKNVRASDDGQTLLGDVEYTPEGRGLVESGTFKFFSPEFSPSYMDPEGKLPPTKNVLIGGGFTNRPLFKDLSAVAASDGTADDKNEILIDTKETDVTLEQLRSKAASEVDAEGMKILTAAKDQLNAEEVARFFPVAADDKTKLEAEAKAKAEQEAAAAKEASDKKAAEDAKAKEAADAAAAIAASEKEGKEAGLMTVSASEWKVLQSRASMGVEAHEKLVAKEAADHVSSIAFSEKEGFKVPSDMKTELTDFYIAADDKTKALMDKVLTATQPILAADGTKEIGAEGSNGGTDPSKVLDDAASEILANDKTNEFKGDYAAALRKAMIDNPDAAKELEQIESAKMPQVSA